MKVGALSRDEAQLRMAASGLALQIPPITVRVRSPLRFLAEQMRDLYCDYELADAGEFADVDIRMLRVREIRKWVHPEVQFIVDGTTPFDPFPLAQALPMFEWGLNWVFAHRMHSYLLLHAAVVERDEQALVLPAWPGSGKSTLAASLSCRGWRYLSDEFGAIALDDAQVLPFARPAALKNESIDVMRAFAPEAFIGEVFPETRKGTVAHFRVPTQSILRGRAPARVAAIVFPDFNAGAPVSLVTLGKATAFLKLAGNAFNYEVVGERGFRAVSALVRRADSCVLRYGDLASAHAAIDDVMRKAHGQK
jgi:HprK-related kinase A